MSIARWGQNSGYDRSKATKIPRKSVAVSRQSEIERGQRRVAAKTRWEIGLIHVVHRRGPWPTRRGPSRWTWRPWEVAVRDVGKFRRGDEGEVAQLTSATLQANEEKDPN